MQIKKKKNIQHHTTQLWPHISPVSIEMKSQESFKGTWHQCVPGPKEKVEVSRELKSIPFLWTMNT